MLRLFRGLQSIRPSASLTGFPSVVPPLASDTTRRFKSKKAKKQSEKDKRRNAYRDWVKNQKKKKHLHPAAKWKRILSSCEFWWSTANLPQDDYLKNELRKHDGWCRISELLTFRSFQLWTNRALIEEALTSTAAHKWEVKDGMVRHRKINLHTLDEWEESDEEDGIDDEEVDEFEEKEEKEEEKDRLPNPRKLKKYRTKRPTIVVRRAKELRNACDQLRASIERSVTQWGEEASAIGFDVEYARQEVDIRNNLPAMLQLAAPGKDGPIVLIWLDKLPDCGKGVLLDDKYEPLRTLLGDASVRKVGVEASGDARHLAEWWGINEREYVNHFISGIVDLDDDIPSINLERRSLKDMTALVLKRNLPKKKSKAKDATKAFWRAEILTDMMKEYAANDAAAGIDIWLTHNDIGQE
jgi:hypothetical protein